MGLQGLWAEFQTQATYAMYIIIVCFLLVVLWRRAFIVGFVGLLAMSIITLFIQAPQYVEKIGTWLGGLLNIG